MDSCRSERILRDILTEQAFYGLRREKPAAILQRIIALTVKACANVRADGPFDKTEDGYPVAYAQIYCANQKGANKNVDVLLKSISGRDAVYVVQREFRRASAPGATAGVMAFHSGSEARDQLKAMTAANHFLRESVVLCPATNGTGRCAASPTSTTPQ